MIDLPLNIQNGIKVLKHSLILNVICNHKSEFGPYLLCDSEQPS
jgi:hypothetical protein